MKEQVSGLYAQTLAEKALSPWRLTRPTRAKAGRAPEINTDDFSSAVDFLGLQPFVDREKIGILGVCGWGGFALNSAIADTRIKVVPTSIMYDMTRMMAKGYFDSVDAENGTVALDVVAKVAYARQTT